MSHEVLINETSVWFTETNFNQAAINIRKNINSEKGNGNVSDYCPFCKQNIKAGESLYTVINNYKLFPNIIVHKQCVDDLGLNKAASLLKISYDNAQEYLKIWR
jgi:hypothetical protein